MELSAVGRDSGLSVDEVKEENAGHCHPNRLIQRLKLRRGMAQRLNKPGRSLKLRGIFLTGTRGRGDLDLHRSGL